jgi:hypothetical protein
VVLVEHWNGSSWSIVSTPASGLNTAFDDLGCAQGRCVAVGTTDVEPLADRWDGTRWTTETVTGEFVVASSAEDPLRAGETRAGTCHVS